MNFLFVCTGNVSRSPAAESVLRRLAGGLHASRSAGISPFSPRPVTGEDVRWADVVAVMEADHRTFIIERWPAAALKLRVLGIEDRYRRHDPVLLGLLEEKLGTLLGEVEGDGMIGS